MRKFYTKYFGAGDPAKIDEWLNSFFNKERATTAGGAYAGNVTIEGYVISGGFILITISRYEDES